MAEKHSTILIAGAGIAGLTAALAFARKGFDVQVLEQSRLLEEFGAGLQISPNASRLLDRIGVIDELGDAACQPEALRLIDSSDGTVRAEMPLGEAAADRWHSSYLVAHRADLHSALLRKVRTEKRISLETGVHVQSAAQADGHVSVAITQADDSTAEADHRTAELLIGADGVWSTVRKNIRESPESAFTGYVAWRAVVEPGETSILPGHDPQNIVSAFLNPGFHLVTYPIRSGKLFNIVAVVEGSSLAERWVIDADISQLHHALRNSSLRNLADMPVDWTAWPLHEVDPGDGWSHGGRTVLIGDAAHAMTPFAAQGAAMAIEDAFALAECVAQNPDRMDLAIERFETIRKPRVQRVFKRGAFNRFTWHASGPVALVRNLVLRTRSGQSLMRDFDWLYGFDAAAEG